MLFRRILRSRALQHVPSKIVAAGSLIFASGALLPLGLWLWPDSGAPISLKAWGCAAMLGVLCTAVAFLLFFRLLSSNGAMAATTVTFLIPGFGILWGWQFLDEEVGLRLISGMLVILVGTAMSVGMMRRVRKSKTEMP